MEKIIHHDIYNIKTTNTSPFVGLVRIYQNGVLNTDQSPDGWLTNMTVASGRQLAAQRLFGFTADLTGHPSFDSSYYLVDSFGIGSGGTSFSSTGDLEFLGPKLCDDDLNTALAINTSAKSNFRGTANVVKKIKSSKTGDSSLTGKITTILAASSEYTECPNKYRTIVKCECIIEPGEPISALSGTAVKIDEAVLYSTNQTTGGSDIAIPFAHICFAPKFLEADSILTIEWHVIF